MYSEFKLSVIKDFTEEQIVHAESAIKSNSRLLERLVTLAEDGVNLLSGFENPWRHEMKAAKITLDDVNVAAKFFKFKEQKKSVELKEYFKSGRGGWVPAKYTA